MSHETYEDIVEVPLAARSATVSDLVRAVETMFETKVESIELDRDVLVDLTCQACNNVVSIGRPRSEVTMSKAICSGCEQVMTLNLISHVTEFDNDQRKLSEIGIPDYEIVKVDTTDGRKFVLLSADASLYKASEVSNE